MLNYLEYKHICKHEVFQQLLLAKFTTVTRQLFDTCTGLQLPLFDCPVDEIIERYRAKVLFELFEIEKVSDGFIESSFDCTVCGRGTTVVTKKAPPFNISNLCLQAPCVYRCLMRYAGFIRDPSTGEWLLPEKEVVQQIEKIIAGFENQMKLELESSQQEDEEESNDLERVACVDADTASNSIFSVNIHEPASGDDLAE